MVNPKVSICIPAYKQPEFLRRTLQSVIIQSFEDYEVIITDDSPDESVQTIVKEFFSPRIKYYKNQEKKGSPGNWNEAIRLAAGKYIKILHHDDWFSDKDSLAEFVKVLDDNPNVDFAFSSSLVCSDDKRIEFVHSPSKLQVERLRHNPNYMFPENFIGSPSATIYRSKLCVKFDCRLKWVVDIDFYIEVLRVNSGIIFIDKPLISITMGSSTQVTSECAGNKNIELFEWLYLYNKLDKTLLPDIKHLRFFWSLFCSLGVKSKQEIFEAGIKPPLPKEISMIILIRRLFS